ncbi:formate dehydrogenase subunit gamma [Oceanibium sediminis]|uniref:formate dehydrogenase subunit gamma n=1 Tax=Oceanibium sediminis TaxID=2026339 RepID=UPI000DD4882B|nr:formate dehydrogenase subunit gamma [Oceanibium sediminis]
MRQWLQAALVSLAILAAPAAAQEAGPNTAAPGAERAATGGATTLEDILARQRGEKVDLTFRAGNTGDPDSAAAITSQLGTLGGASDADVFRALRYGTADVTVSTTSPAAGVLIQDGGMWWLKVRAGPLRTYGGYLLLGMIGLLALFYLLRGRIRIEGEKTGEKVLRFNGVERFAHWLLAGSFLLLGFTGLITLFGRVGLIPLMGKDTYATLALGSKWIHNNVSWAFMLALVMVFVFWVIHNLPNRHDLNWMLKAGGLFSKHSHPPAKKFNAGQKLIFWSVILLGGSISVSGLSLLFPFELPMFAFTFEKLNIIGVPGWFGLTPFPAELAPHEEMQYAQLWHAIISFVLMAIIIAHIYIGSIGMEGAFDAMGSGEVEKQWAEEHHGLWVEELQARSRDGGAARPAE